MKSLKLSGPILLCTLALGCPSDPATDESDSSDSEGEEEGDDTMGGEESTPSTSGSTVDPATSVDPSMSDAEESGPPDDTTEGSTDTAIPDCEDQLILDLGLVQGVISEGAFSDEADGDGFRSSVDATAGGLPNAPTNPWLYLQFTPGGLAKVDIDDFDALSNTDWHLAAKRFGIRLNSGVSGPSTVAAAALIGETYENVTELPNGNIPLIESFYTQDCVLLDDGSGLGTPGYAMTPWWQYPGCVATTNVPFVIELPDGEQVKFIVDSYYTSGQQTCNDTGMMGSGSANFTWRWAFL